MNEEIQTKLRRAIGPLMVSIEQAQQENPGTKIKLMIAAENEDGSGRIVARMDTTEFITDVAALVGYTEADPDDKATHLLGKLGLL